MRQHDATVEVLFSAAEIAHRVDALAGEIAAAMGLDILLISVLKGSFMFTADLMRALHHHGVRPRVDFMTVSSYREGSESGEMRLLRDVDEDVAGQHVLLVDDILDTGQTLDYVRRLMLGRGAAEVRLCVLLDKPGRRKVEIGAEFVGFPSPELFVVGYGLDHAHRYRELPFIGEVVGDPATGG
jgi:hypoxanthine phosphoribosyltransferase